MFSRYCSGFWPVSKPLPKTVCIYFPLNQFLPKHTLKYYSWQKHDNEVPPHLGNHPQPFLADELRGAERARVQERKHVLGHVVKTLRIFMNRTWESRPLRIVFKLNSARAPSLAVARWSLFAALASEKHSRCHAGKVRLGQDCHKGENMTIRAIKCVNSRALIFPDHLVMMHW